MNYKFASALFLALMAASCQATSHSIAPSVPEPTTSGPQPQTQFDTSGWKAYEDSFISFKYPPTWKVVVQKASNGTFVISLDDHDIKNGGVSAIQITLGEDGFSSSIKRRFPDAAVQKTVQQQHITIGGQDAYVLEGALPTGIEDTRVVFTNNLVFIFDSRSHSLRVSGAGQQEIENVFNTLLSTVKF